MRDLAYFNPATISAAVDILAEGQGAYKILAGGTDLVLALKERKLQPAGLVDISNICKLQGIEEAAGDILIKSATTFTDVAASAIVRKKMPALVDACSVVGSPQIRNQGTLGGNLANASPAADTVPVMVLFDGRVKVAGKRGIRELPILELLQGAGKTTLSNDELITDIFFKPAAGSVNAFYKLGRRNALAISRISAALEMVIKNDIITMARVAFGSLGPNPFRAFVLEDWLFGRNFNKQTEELFVETACAFIAERLGARASAVYKKEAVGGVVRQAWHILAARREEVRC